MIKRMMALLFVSAALVGCNSSEQSKVGGDKDEHGCIGSAGYQWCAKTASCERSWELAEKTGFENTPEAFNEYCDN
ncbi:hypothetical protein [Motilimonas sp. KMU-193]|uniref:hypothetical protein n=1 Tax=Motilimonas sp. KMU-193 TaxID=3388668 RepID=UPI00396B2BFF